MSSLATPGTYPLAVPKETSVSQFVPAWSPYNSVGTGATGPAGPSSGAAGSQGPKGPTGVAGGNVPGPAGPTSGVGSMYGFTTAIYSNSNVVIPYGSSYLIATSTWPVGTYALSITTSPSRTYQQVSLTSVFTKQTTSGISGGSSIYMPNLGAMTASADNADTVLPTKIRISNNTNTSNSLFPSIVVYQTSLN